MRLVIESFLFLTMVAHHVHGQMQSTDDIGLLKSVFFRDTFQMEPSPALPTLFLFKDASPFIEKLDSLSYFITDKVSGQAFDRDKTIYRYNDKNLLAFKEMYFRNEPGDAWSGNGKKEYAYDNSGRLTLTQLFRWDWDNNQWHVFSHSKYEITYTPAGLQSVYATFFRDAGGATWINDDKYQYEYDANGNLILYIYSKWNPSTEELELKWQEEMVYNSTGNLIEKTAYRRDTTLDVWVPANKFAYVYNEEGVQTIRELYLWNENTNDWGIAEKDMYEYDDNGNLVVETNYQWTPSTGELNNADITEYTYDGDGLLIGKRTYYWNKESERFENYMRYELSYDVRDNLILSLRSIWSDDLDDWRFFDKEEYTYDTANNELLYAFYTWNTVGGQWVGDSKRESVYDSAGNALSVTQYYWNFSLGQWEPSNRSEYAYDLSLLMSECYMPDEWYYVLFKNKVTEFAYYQHSSSAWNNIGTYRYYYSEVVPTAMEEDSDSAFHFYPNPVEDVLYIKSADDFLTVQVINAMGAILTTQKVDGDGTLHLQDLPAGLYLLKVEKNNGTCETHKLIKR